MHIPENYLSPQTCAVMTVAMVPVWVNAIRKVKKEVPKEKLPALGVSAAFSFVGMMFNIPIPGGTTGHATGGTLAAITVGPNAACIAMSIALLIQALLFGDGGILAFGANCFNMAFLLPFVGYGVYRLIAGKQNPLESIADGGKRRYVGAAIGSYVGINVAALAAAIEFGIQPALFHNAAGQALYCPYGLGVSIPSMMVGHLTIFGAAELIFTLAIYAFICKTSPQMLRNVKNTEKKPIKKPVIGLIIALIIAAPLGLIATGTAWGEWGVEEMFGMIGYTPSGMENGWSMEAIMPDYAIGNLPEIVAYIMSAVIGVVICVLLFRLISAAKKSKIDFGEKY